VSDSKSFETRDENIAFFGAIIAGQSHELTNVFNIINELAGLQLDLLRAQEQGLPVNLPRLHEVAGKIQHQVQRGETIIRNINRFAHSVDLPVAVFDLTEAIERVLFLADRSARLARVELVSDLPPESIVLESNPFCVQQAVFTCIDLALQSASDIRRVAVDYAVHGDGVEIRVTSADHLTKDKNTTDSLELLQFLLESIGGSVVKGPEDEPSGILVFRIPLHRGAASEVP
jgi:signal transduction histidine kinase